MSLFRVNQLKKSFPSVDGESTQIVDVDEFYLKESEFCGMHGESGSGKTTFSGKLALHLQKKHKKKQKGSHS